MKRRSVYKLGRSRSSPSPYAKYRKAPYLYPWARKKEGASNVKP